MKVSSLNPALPGAFAIRAVFLPVVFCLFVSWLSSGVSYAQESNTATLGEAEQELLALEAELDRKIEKTRNLEMEQQEVRASDRAALLYRRDQHSLDVLADIIRIIEKIDTLPPESVAQIAVRSRMTERLESIDDLIIQRLKELDKRITDAHDSMSSLSGADSFSRKAYLNSLYQLRNQVLAAMVQVIPARESLGIPGNGFRSQAELILFSHAERLVALLELSAAASLELSREQGLTKSDPDFVRAQTELKIRHETELAQLIDITKALEDLGLDTASYRATIVKQRGVLSTELFQKEILGSIALDYWNSLRSTLSSHSADVILNALVILLILFVARWLSRLARRATNAALGRTTASLSKLHRDTLVAAVGATTMGVGILLALGQMGISLGPMLAGLGIAGFIIGFALQDSLANFAAGGMILIYRPFDVDDYVEVAGEKGLVKKMSLVTTTIHTFDNQTLVIPNNKIRGSVIKNVTAQRTLRVDLVFGVSYDSDIEKVEKILWEVVSQHPKVLKDPEPKIRVDSLGDSSVNFTVKPWAARDDIWEVRWDLIRSVKMKFDAEGIVIPFPQRDVHLSYSGEPPNPST